MQTVERDLSDLLIKKVQARGRESGLTFRCRSQALESRKHKARNKHCSREGLTEELRGSNGVYGEKLMRK